MRYQWLVFGRDDRLSAESIAWNPASRSSSPGWWRWRSCRGTCPKRDVREKRTKQPVGDAEQDDSRDCRRGGNRGEVKIKKSKRDKHANTSGWKGTKRRKKEERGGKEVVEFIAGTIRTRGREGRKKRKQESWRPNRARAARAGLGPVDGPPPMAARCQVEAAPRACSAACVPWSRGCSGERCASRAADVARASPATRRSPRTPRRGATRN